MVPQAWIELYVPQLRHSASWARPSAWETKHKYRECLLGLVQTFAQLLKFLDLAFKRDFSFSIGGKFYPKSLLQRRNAECLAICLVNLPALHSGIVKTRDDINKVCFNTLLVLIFFN